MIWHVDVYTIEGLLGFSGTRRLSFWQSQVLSDVFIFIVLVCRYGEQLNPNAVSIILVQAENKLNFLLSVSISVYGWLVLCRGGVREYLWSSVAILAVFLVLRSCLFSRLSSDSVFQELGFDIFVFFLVVFMQPKESDSTHPSLDLIG